jgi:hypothetical protein
MSRVFWILREKILTFNFAVTQMSADCEGSSAHSNVETWTFPELSSVLAHSATTPHLFRRNNFFLCSISAIVCRFRNNARLEITFFTAIEDRWLLA